MKKTLLIVGMGLLTLGTVSCKKKGCIDENATNYDATAEKDDESCTYNAVGVLYYDQNTYLSTLLGQGDLEYFADGTSLGTMANNNAWTTSGATPDCSSSSGVFPFTIDMGGQSKKLFTFTLKKASDGTQFFSVDANLDGGVCTAVEFQ